MRSRDLRRMPPLALAVFVAVAGTTEPAAAYIGPGAGISMLGAAIGLLAAFGMALGIVLFWPIRVLLKRVRGGPTTPLPGRRTAASTGRASPPTPSGPAANRAE